MFFIGFVAGFLEVFIGFVRFSSGFYWFCESFIMVFYFFYNGCGALDKSKKNANQLRRHRCRGVSSVRLGSMEKRKKQKTCFFRYNTVLLEAILDLEPY